MDSLKADSSSTVSGGESQKPWQKSHPIDFSKLHCPSFSMPSAVIRKRFCFAMVIMAATRRKPARSCILAMSLRSILISFAGSASSTSSVLYPCKKSSIESEMPSLESVVKIYHKRIPVHLFQHRPLCFGVLYLTSQLNPLFLQNFHCI